MLGKTVSTSPTTSSKWRPTSEVRMFGEEIDTNNNNNNMVDMSMLSMESRDDIVPTMSTMIDDHGGGSIATEYSDCDGTEVSSVAHLREWLDDFGKHSKEHYQKNAIVGKAPSDIHLDRPVRPKISRSSMSVPPTPLPFNAANALSKRMNQNNNQNNNSGINSNNNKSAASLKTTRTTTNNHMSRRKSTGIMRHHHHHHHHHITPVIFKPKFDSQDVQATDQGYASVAKLSAWLADDPTRTKKVRQIRRGANIIAKSRAFDKGLENVIVEQTNIRNGHVAGKKKDWIMKMTASSSSSSSSQESTNENEPDEQFGTPAVKKKKKRSMEDDDDSVSTANVADKKKWLSSAFQKDHSNTREGIFSVPTKAQARTDFITAQDERDDLTSRAKHLWRHKRSPMKENAAPRPASADNVHQSTPLKTNPIATEAAATATTSTSAPISAVPVESSDIPNKINSVTIASTNLSTFEQHPPAPSEDTSTFTKNGTLSAKKERSMDDDDNVSTANVADKKKWLSSAFKKENSNTREGIFSVPTKAQARTDFITAQDERDDLTSRAKHLWRSKRSPMKENAPRTGTDNALRSTPLKTVPVPTQAATASAPISASPVKSSDIPSKTNSVTDVFANLSIAEQQPPALSTDTSTLIPETTKSTDTVMDFHSARQLLVERSKANGSLVKGASKVQRSKAKYERLRQNVIQLNTPNGLLKAAWETDENGPSSGGSYVKTFREDHPKPKSFHELP